MSGKTIEFAPFRAKAGVDEDTMLALSNRLEGEFLAQQPGYIRRELLKAEDGSFVDLVWWESPAAAEAAMTKVADSEVCAAYFAAMELASAAEAVAASLGAGASARSHAESQRARSAPADIRAIPFIASLSLVERAERKYLFRAFVER